MVIRKVVAGVAVLSAVTLALAGCSHAASQSDSSTPALHVNLNNLATTTTPGTEPVDTITWNLPYEPLSLDPMHTFNYAENTVTANMCESLLRMKPDLTTVPGLATAVSAPNDLTYVYTIRRGVKFWDGHPLTAEDVAYSLERQVGPTTTSYYASYFANVKSVTATGPDQVTVALKSPDSQFPQAMASAAGAVVEKSVAIAGGNKFGSPGVNLQCTGPYRLDTWSPGKYIELTKSDDYWDTTVHPKVDHIKFSFIADESTAVNALRSGEVDGQYFYLPPAGLGQLEKSSNVTTTFGKSLVFWALAGTADHGPFADPRVREALSLAIDRAALAKVVFQNAAIPLATLAGPDYWGYERSEFQQAYAKFSTSPDIAKAKKLVQQAGSPKTPIVVAIQGSSTVHEQTGALIQAAGQALGLNIQLKVIPVEQYGNLYNQASARKGIDALLTTYYGNFADPVDIYQMFRIGNANNFSNWNDADSILNKAVAANNPQERAQIAIQAQTMITKAMPWIPIEYEPTTLVESKRISGATASFAYLYGPWAVTIGGVK